MTYPDQQPAGPAQQQVEPQTQTQPESGDALDALASELDNITSPDGAAATETFPDDPQARQQRQQAQPGPGESDVMEPPAHWPEEQKELFRSQSPEGQRFLLERHRQMEADYTRKTQHLAEQARAVAGLQGLAQRLNVDPAFRTHLQSYFQQQQQGQPQAQFQQQQQQDEPDPIEEIKQEAAGMAYARIKQEQAQTAAAAKQHEFQQAFTAAQRLKQEDPLAKDVQARLDAYVKAQKHPIRMQETYAQLDSNPFFYLEMYRVMREELMAEQQGQEQEYDDQPPSQQPPPRFAQAGNRPPAPSHERPGGARPQTSQQKQQKRRSKLKAEVLRSGSTEALGAFLDDVGLIDQLV